MRLFFGLSLPDDIRAVTRAYAESLSQSMPGRYALPENHHITLAFLGDVPPERLPDAHAALAPCIAAFPAPLLTLSAPGHFGKAQNGILILRVCSVPALEPLHEQLVWALSAAGLPADPGPFSPHITLARHAQIPGVLPSCPCVSFRAAQAHVYLSARDAQHVLRYTPLSSAPFAGIREEI